MAKCHPSPPLCVGPGPGRLASCLAPCGGPAGLDLLEAVLANCLLHSTWQFPLFSSPSFEHSSVVSSPGEEMVPDEAVLCSYMSSHVQLVLGSI